MTVCVETTAKGLPCKRPSLAGSDKCASHMRLVGKKPPDFSSESTQQLLTMIRAGNRLRVACAAVGIARRTFEDWERKGHEGLEPYAAFTRELEQARGEGEARLITIISRAATDDWKAAAWIGEREYGWMRPTPPSDDEQKGEPTRQGDSFETLPGDELAQRRASGR
jgi:hypothetical protein